MSLWLPLASLAAEQLEFDLPSGEMLSVQHYPNPNGPQVLLLPSVFAVPKLEHAYYLSLQKGAGFDLFVADFIGAHFLSEISSSWAKIPTADVAATLQQLHARDPQRPLLVMANGSAFLVALHGAQQAGDSAPVAAAIGLSADLYPGEVSPGEIPQTDPLIAELDFPLLMFQPQHSARYWWLDLTREALAAGKPPHRVTLLDDARDGFYHREDRTPRELELSAQFPHLLREQLKPLLAERRQ